MSLCPHDKRPSDKIQGLLMICVSVVSLLYWYCELKSKKWNTPNYESKTSLRIVNIERVQVVFLMFGIKVTRISRLGPCCNSCNFHIHTVHLDTVKIIFTYIPCILILSKLFSRTYHASWYRQNYFHIHTMHLDTVKIIFTYIPCILRPSKLFSHTCHASWYCQNYFHIHTVHLDTVKIIFIYQLMNN
jgi:hypothetical protein